MAGLGEACSHVGALLFALEATIKLQKDRTCTDLPCYWSNNASQKLILYEEISNIKFINPAKRLSDSDNSIPFFNNKTRTQKLPANLSPPTEQQTNELYDALRQSNTNSAILSLIPPYNTSFIPKSTFLPPSISSFHDPQYDLLSPSELLEKTDAIFNNYSLTQQQVCKDISIAFDVCQCCKFV